MSDLERDMAYDCAERREEELREALDELQRAVREKLPTMNHYFGPGARTAVGHDDVESYRRIVAALAKAQECLDLAGRMILPTDHPHLKDYHLRWCRVEALKLDRLEDGTYVLLITKNLNEQIGLELVEKFNEQDAA